MNRQNRLVLVFAMALGLASLASYGVYRVIQNMPVREVEVASMYVAVASENLPTGTRLTRDHIRVIGWPANSPVEGGFDAVDGLVGRGLIQSVSVNEPLTERKLAPIEAGAGLPPSIPEGMRALSVRVNEVIGVAGFTVPGTRVDVLVTLQQQEEPLARTVVSNVQVLTAGTRYDQEAAKDGQPLPSTVVTLLVTPDDAERITLAQNVGSIMLVLRNPLDVLPTQTGGARRASLLGAPAASPVVKTVEGRPRVVTARPAAPAPAPQDFYRVEAIRAGKRTVEDVR